MIELIHIGATKGHPKQRQIYIIICFHTTNSTIFFPFLFLYNKTTTQKQQKRFLFQDYSLQKLHTRKKEYYEELQKYVSQFGLLPYGLGHGRRKEK